MTCSVNLVPTARMHARDRARRRTGWITACAALTVLVAAGWTTHVTAAGASNRLSDEVVALEQQQAQIHQRLASAGTRRTELVNQLEALGAARCPQPWARRLLDLTREAPEGVVLTTLEITTPDAAPAAPGRGRTPPGAAAQAEEPSADERVARTQTVKLLGHVLDHGALIQFLNTLQGLPGWTQVELVRAVQQPYRGGFAVAFELDCRTQEAVPDPRVRRSEESP